MDDYYKHNLLDCCQGLHGEASGSGSGNHSAEEIIEMFEFVEMRVRTWKRQPPGGPWDRYDDAVLEVCNATLAECRGLYDGLKRPPTDDEIDRAYEAAKRITNRVTPK